MHSLALAKDILEAVLTEAEKNNSQHIRAIKVRVEDGYLTESDSLQFCLEAAAQGTIAEGARMEVELAAVADGGFQITLEMD